MAPALIARESFGGLPMRGHFSGGYWTVLTLECGQTWGAFPHQDLTYPRQTLNGSDRCACTKNFVSVRLYSAPQSHWNTGPPFFEYAAFGEAGSSAPETSFRAAIEQVKPTPAGCSNKAGLRAVQLSFDRCV